MLGMFPNWIDTTYGALHTASRAGVESTLHNLSHIEYSTININDFTYHELVYFLPYATFNRICLDHTCNIYSPISTWLPKHLATYDMHNFQGFSQKLWINPDILVHFLLMGIVVLLLLLLRGLIFRVIACLLCTVIHWAVVMAICFRFMAGLLSGRSRTSTASGAWWCRNLACGTSPILEDLRSHSCRALTSVVPSIVIFPLVGPPYLDPMFLSHVIRGTLKRSAHREEGPPPIRGNATRKHDNINDAHIDEVSTESHLNEPARRQAGTNSDSEETNACRGDLSAASASGPASETRDGQQQTCHTSELKEDQAIPTQNAHLHEAAVESPTDHVICNKQSSESTRHEPQQEEPFHEDEIFSDPQIDQHSKYESFKRFSHIGRPPKNMKRARPNRKSAQHPTSSGTRRNADENTPESVTAADDPSSHPRKSPRKTSRSETDNEANKYRGQDSGSPRPQRQSSSDNFWSDPDEYFKQHQAGSDKEYTRSEVPPYQSTPSHRSPPQRNFQASDANKQPEATHKSRQHCTSTAPHHEDDHQKQEQQQERRRQIPIPTPMSDLPFEPYTILHLPRNASTPQINSAFRKISLKHHPDKLRADATAEEFQAAKEAQQHVNRAHEILSDHILRIVYHFQGIEGVSNREVGEMYRSAYGQFESERVESWFAQGQVERSLV